MKSTRLATVQAVGLLAAFLFIKTIVLIERGEVNSIAGLAAFFYIDMAVTVGYFFLASLLFSVAERSALVQLSVKRFSWALFVLLVLYTGINLIFLRLFSSPLTFTLIEMAGDIGDLRSSIFHVLTPFNLSAIFAAIAIALLTACLLNYLLDMVGRQQSLWRVGLRTLVILAASLFIIAGYGSSQKIDTRGLERNPLSEILVSLITSRVSRPVSLSPEAPIREIDFDNRTLTGRGLKEDDLIRFKGVARGMNLVMVVLESTGAAYLKPYGSESDPMPTVTRLSSNSIQFDNYYSVTPSSMKSLFSMMCSMDPYPKPTAESYIAPRIPCLSLPEVLAGEGYRNILLHSGKFSYTAKDRFFKGRGFEAMYDAKTMKINAADDKESSPFSWGIDERQTLKRALQFLDTLSAEERFFLMYVPVFPHHPYSVPSDKSQSFGNKTEFQFYLNSLFYVDSVLGNLYEALEERGLAKNTIVVVTGDHSEAFNQHEGNYLHSIYLYDENIHVPLFISNPGLFPGNFRTSIVGSHKDLTPTILELLDITVPGRYQGDSLLGGERRMAYFFTDYSFLLLGLRDDKWKYIFNVKSKREELYNLEEDHGERINLAMDRPDIVGPYRKHIKDWYQHQVSLIPNYEEYLEKRLSVTRN